MKRQIYLYFVFFILSIPVTGWAQSDIPRSFLLAGGNDEPLLFAQAFSTGQSVPREGLEAEMVGKWEDALRIYRGIVEKEPERQDIWLRIADIEWSLGNASSSAEAIESAVRISPNDDGLYFRLAQAYAVADNPAKAFSAIEKAVELDPKNIEYLRARAQIANWNGHPEIADDSYKRILEMSPDDYNALLNKARTESWLGELDEAVFSYKKYLKKYPEDKDALIEYIKVEAWRGNYPVALESLERYREKFGETKDYRKEKARVLTWAARPAEAMKLIGPLLQDEPDNYEVNFSNTIALHYANRPEEMLKSLGIVRRLRPDSRETKDLKLFVTTPIRSNINFGVRYYEDSDELSIFHTFIEGEYFIKPVTSLQVGVKSDYLSAKKGSGLEHIDGDEDANYYSVWIGLKHRFSPRIAGRIHLGSSFAEGDTKIPTYGLTLDYQPRDNLRLSYEREYDYYIVSPRTVSLGIKRGLNQLSLHWEPSLRDTLDVSLGYHTLSDGNERWEIILSPYHAFQRTENYNLDLGLRAIWFALDDDLDHGYYDPELYQSYMATAYIYWKVNDNNGVSIVGASGIQKDETMDSFRFGYDIALEGTFGIFSDWMLKLRGGITQNMRQEAGAYKAFFLGADLTRRF